MDPRRCYQEDHIRSNYTRGCPCDTCDGRERCFRSGYECQSYISWVHNGARHDENRKK